MRRVVVTGIRAITPIANTAQGFWQSLLGGKSGAANITRFDTIRFKTKFACEVKGFEPESFLSKAAVRKYDLFTLYALAAVQEAINHASLNFERLDKDNIGVIWGAGAGKVTQILHYSKGDYGMPYVAMTDKFTYANGNTQVKTQYNEKKEITETTAFQYDNEGRMRQGILQALQQV